MKRFLFSLLFINMALYGDEYSFDMNSIKQKPYEYLGYLRIEDKAQRLNNFCDDYQNYIHVEGLFDFTYNYEMFKFKTSVIATHDYIKDKIKKSEFVKNDLYLETKLSANHTFLIGKKSLQWGKGYFFNPIAFFDRAKNPSSPTQAREGYIVAKYSYNKSFDNDLKNLSFDFVYLPSTNTINTDYYKEITDNKDATNLATRLYLLVYDTDIDIIFNYSSEANDKVGIDFSKNIQTNFEIHGEYANVINNGYSYLLGIRYLTDFELTIISEYLYQSTGLTRDDIKNSTSVSPFVAKNYWMTLVTQKEPFDWLYSSIYYKNIMNLQDYSQQHKVGVTYSFKNNLNIDLSYNQNSGVALSEYGKKQVQDFLWLKFTWNF